MKNLPSFEEFINERLNEAKDVRIILTKDIEDDLYDDHAKFFDGPKVIDYSANEFMCKQKDLKACEDYLKKNKIEYKIHESVELNEEAAVDGYEMGPETEVDMFDEKITDIRQLNTSDEYILLDLGMGEWMSSWSYKAKSPVKHVFSSTLQFNDVSLEFTRKELIAAIKGGEIYLQK